MCWCCTWPIPAELELARGGETRYRDPENAPHRDARARRVGRRHIAAPSQAVVRAWGASCRAAGVRYALVTTDQPFGHRARPGAAGVIGFTAPWALLGLAAAALPLMLHLLQRHEPPEVVFPAVRYLEDATRRQRRRVQLRNLLLLLVRTLLIVAVVLAAAGATWQRGSIGTHAPTALVLVVDNSASSGAIVDGEPQLAALVAAADRVLDRAAPTDRLWLVAADGVARAGSAAQLRAHLHELAAEPVRLDLGAAISHARTLIAAAGLPGEVVVATDAQRTALGPAQGSGPLLVVRPVTAEPSNRAIAPSRRGCSRGAPMAVRSPSWSPPSDTTPVPVTLAGGRARRARRAAHAGRAVGAAHRRGAHRLDHARRGAAARRIAARRLGGDIAAGGAAGRGVVGQHRSLHRRGTRCARRRGTGPRAATASRSARSGPAPSVVLPPADPAQTGALDRQLAGARDRLALRRHGRRRRRRPTASTLLAGRVSLEPPLDARADQRQRRGAGHRGRFTVGGAQRQRACWSGRGSTRLDRAAAHGGVRAVPRRLLTRAVRGEPLAPDAVAGEPISLPDRVTAVTRGRRHDAGRAARRGAPPLPASTACSPAATPSERSRCGIDPRESALARASDSELRGLWAGAVVAGVDRGYRARLLAGRAP